MDLETIIDSMTCHRICKTDTNFWTHQNCTETKQTHLLAKQSDILKSYYVYKSLLNGMQESQSSAAELLSSTQEALGSVPEL